MTLKNFVAPKKIILKHGPSKNLTLKKSHPQKNLTLKKISPSKNVLFYIYCHTYGH